MLCCDYPGSYYRLILLLLESKIFRAPRVEIRMRWFFAESLVLAAEALVR